MTSERKLLEVRQKRKLSFNVSHSVLYLYTRDLVEHEGKL